MSSLFPLVVLFLIVSPPFSCSSTSQNTLSKGSSLSVENPDDVLISPKGKFTAGFYRVGHNAYCFAIWFSKPSCPRNNCTVVWMANRDEPVNGKRSRLSLLKTGNLILTDASGRGRLPVWATGTASDASLQLELDDYGNLFLHHMMHCIWQSFKSPTDTLLPQQPFTRDTQLVSSTGRSNFSTGFYKFYFDNDNVLHLLFNGPEISSVFWPDPGFLPWEEQRSTYNSSRIAILDAFGNFSATDNFTFSSADYGQQLQRRLTLDFDGNLRLYSREEQNDYWVVSWQLTSQPCTVHGVCGPNSVCTYDPYSGRRCSCIPGFKKKNQTDWSMGCIREFGLSCASNAATFLKLRHVEFYGYDFGFFPNTTLDKCKEKCLQRCDCKGFQFKFIKHDHPSDIPYCFPKTLLLNGQRAPNFEGDLYLKVPKNNQLSFSNWPADDENSWNCSHNATILPRKYVTSRGIWSLRFLLWFVTGVGLFEILSIILVLIFLLRNHESTGTTQGYLQAATGFKRFTYAELKKATRNFKEEIGRGAGGIVYRGKLSDDRVAAIKLLNEARQGEAEFLAEVSTIGKLNHMYLIDMWGYCTDKNHRLLVYEYMEHGSLAENLSSKSLDWKQMFEIAVGTARGLAYLHEECLEWVLHCDVKPQNILLDSDYRPKVSDFGLSRLVSRVNSENSGFSKLRGTRGYMAPEWVFNLPITSKVDVYSYGIVVLQMVTGKSPAMDVENVEDKRLVAWVRGKKSGAVANRSWVTDIIDPIITNDYNINQLEISVEVALQCVEEDRDARPTMSQVVEQLLREEK
ncbi:serine-threonine protein kinase, plant-type, putative [Ricinus communis]|uniref:Receptor-like serine/threonine-protein kinase n=2 Tax=Ricinus communis TaxID=3988 RepID=B9R758_RICCO|nr:serine-threonine protein kinase, plant-type, putative [Ricinus communis]